MTSAGAALSRLEGYLDSRGISIDRRHIVSLTGDASDRRYFRIAPDGVPSRIAAVYAGSIMFESLPFTQVGRLFSAMPVPVPRILDHDDALGVIVQDDLGDVTLQTRLRQATPSARDRLYLEALEILTVIQRRGEELRSPDLLPYQLAFDVEKLTWELQFFVTHFLEAHRRAAIAPAPRAALNDAFAEMAGELSSEPRVLCHRDYHSRNLMVHEDCLWVIDFQDARLGPDTYDLVSLLRDAYVDLPEGQVDELIARFRSLKGTGGSDKLEFRRRFDLMAAQRTMKALGTFGYQATSRGNASYLENVPRTLAALRAILAAYQRFDRLHRTLAVLVSRTGVTTEQVAA